MRKRKKTVEGNLLPIFFRKIHYINQLDRMGMSQLKYDRKGIAIGGYRRRV